MISKFHIYRNKIIAVLKKIKIIQKKLQNNQLLRNKSSESTKKSIKSVKQPQLHLSNY